MLDWLLPLPREVLVGGQMRALGTANPYRKLPRTPVDPHPRREVDRGRTPSAVAWGRVGGTGRSGTPAAIVMLVLMPSRGAERPTSRRAACGRAGAPASSAHVRRFASARPSAEVGHLAALGTLPLLSRGDTRDVPPGRARTSFGHLVAGRIFDARTHLPVPSAKDPDSAAIAP
jgi:hypothetical protein